jgi:hypothetical protein
MLCYAIYKTTRLPITYLVMRHELTKPTCRYRGTLAQAVAAAIATDNNVRATYSRWVAREGRGEECQRMTGEGGRGSRGRDGGGKGSGSQSVRGRVIFFFEGELEGEREGRELRSTE